MLYVIRTIEDGRLRTAEPVADRTIATFEDTQYGEALVECRKYRQLPGSYAIVTDHPEFYEPGS